MIHLSDRLQAVADQMLSSGVVADIGCDHGFTSIYLVSQGKATGAIAMDIHEGPLKRAEEHVAEAGLQKQIELRLSDGTERLMPGEADTLLISGIGGALMEQILRANPAVTGQAEEMVLSPQSEVYRVRYCLHEMGFRIERENMVFDMGKYYVILRAVPGEEHYRKRIEYTYGKYLIEQRNLVFRQYMLKEKQRVDRILQCFPAESDPEKRKLLEQEAQDICDVLMLLDQS